MKPVSKIYYAAGPGDIVGTFRHWLKGRDDPSEFAIAYSAQFFDLASDRQARVLAVSSCPRPDEEREGGFTVRNRPSFPSTNRGVRYHLAQLVGAARLLSDLLRFRPDVAVISEGTAPWLALFPARWLGVRLIPSIHCVLWPKGERKSLVKTLRRRAEAVFFRHAASHCLCVSEAIASQVRELAGDAAPPCHIFTPSYRENSFAGLKPAARERRPLRLLYAGRVERDKGVFDLLEAVCKLKKGDQGPVLLTLCGTGSAFASLKEFVAKNRLADSVRIQGHCGRAELRDHLADTHVVVVPTTSAFVEGFNKSVAEGVLAQRPVIATSVCPAAFAFSDAVTVIAPDRPYLLADAIARFATDPDHYARQVGRCKVISREFNRRETSWKKTLFKAIADRPLTPDQLPVSSLPTPTRVTESS